MTNKAEVLLAAIDYARACYNHGLYAEEEAVEREKIEDERYERLKQKLDEFECALLSKER